jgi:hypothetical protein
LDLGNDTRRQHGVIDGGLDAQTIRLEGNIDRRAVGDSGIIYRYAGPEWISVCIEQSFSGQFSSIKALFPGRGAAVLACELAGLPWSAINLSKLKLHATGKDNARLPRRRGGCRSEEDEADPAWTGAQARQGRVNAGIRLWNSSTSLWPVIPTAAIMARAINPAMRLYSMAVAADSSRRNFPNISCSLEL